MSGEPTEEPSAKKLREARRRGEVWKSKELGGALTVLVAAGVLAQTAGAILDAHVATFGLALDAAAGRGVASPGAVLEASVALAAGAIAPLLGGLMIAAALGSLVQVGPLFATDAIGWKPERLDPIAGAKNLFSQKRAIELLKTLVIIVVVGGVAWITLCDSLRGTLGLTGRDAIATLRGGSEIVRTLLLRVGGAMLCIAVLDVVYQRWRFMRDQRMSKEDLKREHKEADGDPHVRQQRERMRHEIAQHGALEQVRKADVLVVNPTHLAIALRFDEESDQGAPEVLAKGQDELAQRMIEVAREAGIPIMRDVPLAHGLFELEIGDEIPEALYEAVAAVLRAAWSERAQGEDGR